jgi:hypothetical protein
MSPSVCVLSEAEQADLARCERALLQGRRKRFRQVALALWEIKDRRLYRQGFSTFEAYLQERWGFSRAWGHAMATAGGVVKEKEDGGLPAPTSQREAKRMTQFVAPPQSQTRQDDDGPSETSEPAKSAPAPRHQARRLADDKQLGKAELTEIADGISQRIHFHLSSLERLHAAHPCRGRADGLLKQYREVFLPWPPALCLPCGEARAS